jgi:hypothetical protein
MEWALGRGEGVAGAVVMDNPFYKPAPVCDSAVSSTHELNVRFLPTARCARRRLN